MDTSRIEAALLESGGSELSDGFLAEYLNVNCRRVAMARKILEAVGAIPVTTVRACRDGTVRNIERIGHATRSDDGGVTGFRMPTNQDVWSARQAGERKGIRRALKVIEALC